nr:NAD(+) synthase [Lactimicrobium massiliense]
MIKIGTAVPRLKVGDVKANTEEICTLIQSSDCALLVFPELCISGYTCADLFGSDALLQQAKEGLLQIAEATRKHCAAAVGLPIAYGNSLYNCAALCANGRLIAIIPKINIPTYSEFYESRWFASGKDIRNKEIMINDQPVPFGWDVLVQDEKTGAVIGMEICEDLWVADKPSTHAVLAGANIILNLSASDEIIGKKDYRRQMIIQQSAACYCAYAYASSGNDESSTDLVFSRHCLIAENGRLLSEQFDKDRPYINTAIIDLDTISYNRRHQNTFGFEMDGYRHVNVSLSPLADQSEITSSQLASVLQKEKYQISRSPFVPSDAKERGERSRSILAIQAAGLATRVRNTGIHNLVIGISGGLDSTLALLVCHEAKKKCKDINIIAYTLPNEGNTTSHTYNNAKALMNMLADECREVAINAGVNSHLKDIGHALSYQGASDTAYENAQARMRTYILMDVANMENGLVVGTGDLSELALGWCTYNGDHMSMYAVNTSVPKTLVQYICRSYADTCGNKELADVLYSICDTPITPELTPSSNGQIAQKTEEKIGKYDLNDFFLFYTLRYGMDPQKVIAFALCAYPELDLASIKTAAMRFYKRFFQQQFKRSCLPDGPKVGSVTLSPRGDWRMPSDASVSLWIERVKKAS